MIIQGIVTENKELGEGLSYISFGELKVSKWDDPQFTCGFGMTASTKEAAIFVVGQEVIVTIKPKE